MRFHKNFLEIRKNANAERVEKIFRKFFHAFFKYRKYRNYCGGVSILSNLPRYRHYRILQGIYTIELVSMLLPSLAPIAYRNVIAMWLIGFFYNIPKYELQWHAYCSCNSKFAKIVQNMSLQKWSPKASPTLQVAQPNQSSSLGKRFGIDGILLSHQRSVTLHGYGWQFHMWITMRTFID